MVPAQKQHDFLIYDWSKRLLPTGASAQDAIDVNLIGMKTYTFLCVLASRPHANANVFGSKNRIFRKRSDLQSVAIRKRQFIVYDYFMSGLRKRTL